MSNHETLTREQKLTLSIDVSRHGAKSRFLICVILFFLIGHQQQPLAFKETEAIQQLPFPLEEALWWYRDSKQTSTLLLFLLLLVLILSWNLQESRLLICSFCF